MLTYRCTDTFKVAGFSDSNYAGCMDDKKSTSGYIFMMTLTTSSTMKVDYVACYEATCHAIWLWNFILS